jgi:hypothetical protein
MQWQRVTALLTAAGLAACLVGASPSAACQRPRSTGDSTAAGACAETEAWAKAHATAARLFGATSAGEGYDPKGSKWQEYGSQQQLEQAAEDGDLFYQASVWTPASGSVLVQTVETSFSGDWGLTVVYCFRPSGTLAQVTSELRMLPSQVMTRQSITCDEKGRRISRRTTRQDLETGAELGAEQARAARAYEVIPTPLYKRVADLPFYRLLARARPRQ